jgi:hypothetical protein
VNGSHPAYYRQKFKLPAYARCQIAVQCRSAARGLPVGEWSNVTYKQVNTSQTGNQKVRAILSDDHIGVEF